MNFENTFTVPAPAHEVWQALMDVARVAPCMPGAEVLEQTSEDNYKVGIKVKVGPITMLYRGQVEIVEKDEQSFRATMRARAQEARGQGTANADVRMSLVESGTETQATMTTELQLIGRAAAMGQGVIADVSERLVQEFARNLRAMLIGGPTGAGSATESAQESAPERAPAAGHGARPGAAPRAIAEPGTAATPPPPPPPPASGQALPAGRIAAEVIVARLRDPRTLLLATATVAALAGAIGFAVGKSRRLFCSRTR